MNNVRGFQFGEFTPITPVDLPKGVTRSSLMEMRATGMSNQAIANALSIAAWKVAKAIGGTPKEIKDKIKAKAAAKARTAKAEKRDQAKAQGAKAGGAKSSLVKVCEVYTLKGAVGHYVVDTLRKVVRVTREDGKELLSVPFADCEAFALELMDVLGEIGK